MTDIAELLGYVIEPLVVPAAVLLVVLVICMFAALLLDYFA